MGVYNLLYPPLSLLGMGRKYKCPCKLPNGSMCGLECGTLYEAEQHNIQWHCQMNVSNEDDWENEVASGDPF